MKNEEWSNVFKHPSRMFNRNLINPTDGIVKIRNLIFTSIPLIEDKEFVLDRYRKCIDLILMNLYIASKAGQYLRIAMNHRFRYRSPVCEENQNVYAIWRCKEILDTMVELKLIKRYTGFQAKSGFQQGRLTMIVPTDLLKNKFGDYWSFDLGSFDNTPIILRDENKKLTQSKDITYEDRKLIKEWGKIVNQLNELYKKVDLTCHVPISILDQRLGEKLAEQLSSGLLFNKLNIIKDHIYNPNIDSMNNINEYNQDVDININNNNIYKYTYLYMSYIGCNPCNYLKLFKNLGFTDSVNFFIKPKSIYRVFNENYKSSGRFYGPTYQQISKVFRKYLKINGEEAVELDYNALHLRMLYHSLKIDFRDDPYITPNGKGREDMKKVALIAINADNRRAAIGGICKDFNDRNKEITREQAVILLDYFISNNKSISKAFYSGKWKELCFADSTIMNNILVELMNQNIVGFPIHDSIIVKKKHEETLRQIMIDKYKELFGFDPII
jgi:hypothetical protein